VWSKVLLRIGAVFVASGLSVIGAGAIVGIGVFKSVLIAGLTGVAAVVERLAREFVNDGVLDEPEIERAFHQDDKQK
jgi:hypothetical protein